jgi:hypothetical protein
MPRTIRLELLIDVKFSPSGQAENKLLSRLTSVEGIGASNSAFMDIKSIIFY